MNSSDRSEGRLHSLDALRGFDMLWILGGREVLLAVTALLGWTGTHRVLEHQLEHVPWHGYAAWDLIFPLFLFLAGVSMPLSFQRRLDQGHSRSALARHTLRRGLILVFLGLVYNGLFGTEPWNLRCASVLGRIGLAWMVAAWIVLFFELRGQLVWTALLLAGYGAALQFYPVPEFGAGDLSQGRNVADWFDQQLLPGRLYLGDHDPEGLLSTLPAVATALMGVLAGRFLRSGGWANHSPARRAGLLAAAGVGVLLAGQLLHLLQPVNKRIWTPSFALVAAGWSSLLLAGFYFVIDVRGWRKWSWPFAIVGCNAIAAYLLNHFIDFDGLAALLLHDAAAKGTVRPEVVLAAGLALEMALLWWMWRRRWFLKV